MWSALLLACADGDAVDRPRPAVQAADPSPTAAPPPAGPPPAPAPPPGAPPFGPAPPSPRANALLIVVDTLRADAVAAARTPAIDGLAARGRSVPVAWSAGTWTVPGVISLFTGLSVRQHGWDEPTGLMGEYPLLPDTPTLAEVLREAGFTTAGLYANPYLDEALGFHRGFDTWRRAPDAALVRELAKVIESDWGQPGRHFAYVHLLGPHSPLKPSAEARRRWGVEDRWFDETRYGLDIGVARRARQPGAREAYRRGYHAAVEDADALVGALLEVLGEHRDDTLIVLTSDHGELLGEHDLVGHGAWIWAPLTHVPLVVEGGPALPDTLGAASVPGLITRGLGLDHAWPTLDHGWIEGLPLAAQREGLVALSPDGVERTLWLDPDDPGSLRHHHLDEDPGEARPSPPEPEVLALRAAWEAAVPPGASGEGRAGLPQETEAALRTLGYLR